MHHDGSPAGLVLGDNPLVEGQHGGGIVWDSMVWPGGVVELLHLPRTFIAVIQLHWPHISHVAITESAITYSELQCPGGVVREDLLFCDGDFEGSKVFGARVWPVLLTLLLVTLLTVGHHDDGRWSLLPYQSPEINKHMSLGA